MTVTPQNYAPAASPTAGYSLIGISATLPAKLSAATVSELAGSTMVQGATDAFGTTTDASTTTRQMIGDKVATESVGNRKYALESMNIKLGDPQEQNDILDLLTLDARVFLWMRPGLQADADGTIAAIAAGQNYVGLVATVASVDLAPISTAEGDEYAAIVSFAVRERTQLFGKSVA